MEFLAYFSVWLANLGPRHRLYSDIVNDTLSEYSYDADIAGLSYKFMQHPSGLFVSMSGYNDKMAVLVQHVLEKIKGLVVNPQRLAVMKEQVTGLIVIIRTCNLRIYHIGKKRLGEFFPWTILFSFRLFWTLHHLCTPMDTRREIERIALYVIFLKSKSMLICI